MLARNLLYTGVTRGKQARRRIGQPRAMAIAVRNVRATQRLTNLAARLRGEEPATIAPCESKAVPERPALSKAAPLQSFLRSGRSCIALCPALVMSMYEIYTYAPTNLSVRWLATPVLSEVCTAGCTSEQPFLALPNTRPEYYGCSASHGSCDPDSVCGLPGYFSDRVC